MTSNIVETIKEKLQTTLKAIHVVRNIQQHTWQQPLSIIVCMQEVTDTSGGCGQNIEVVVVSDVFEGKGLLQRHRAVNECLAEEIATIHSFKLKTHTSKQWTNNTNK